MLIQCKIHTTHKLNMTCSIKRKKLKKLLHNSLRNLLQITIYIPYLPQ